MLHSIYNWLRKPLDRFLENEIIHRLITNSGYLFSATSISAALSMLQGILIARLLGVEEFGVLGTITLFISVVNKLVSFRMGELVVKYVGFYEEDQDHERAAAIFKSSALVEMLTSFFAFGLVLLLAPIGARYFAKDPTLTYLFRIYGFIILANLVGESSIGLLQIFDRFRRMSALNIVQSIVTLSLIVLVYFTNGGLTEILLAYLTGKVVGALGVTLASFIEAARRWGIHWWKVPLNLIRPKRRELAHFAISTNISATISLITKDSEILWVSFFRSPLEAGYYKLALALANMAQIPISPLPLATYPELSRQAARKNWGNFRYIMRQGSILAGGYTIAATIFLVLFGRPLIRLVYTPEFLPAYPALLILLVGYLFANIFYWRRPALLALGLPDFPAKVNSILAGLKIVGVILFVPVYGYLASAALLASFYISGSVIYALKIRSQLSLLDKRA
jgi:O-antigen/teichoic acid export membrane protein